MVERVQRDRALTTAMIASSLALECYFLTPRLKLSDAPAKTIATGPGKGWGEGYFQALVSESHAINTFSDQPGERSPGP